MLLYCFFADLQDRHHCGVTLHFFAFLRVEHEAFSERDGEAYKQLVRVVVRDFLPFVKQMFDSLYSEERVEQLALSTPYALQHATPPLQVGARGIGAKPTVELRMKLEVEELYEPLRSVAPDVITEVESARRPNLLNQQEEVVPLATDIEPAAALLEEGGEGEGVLVEDAGGDTEDTGVEEEGSRGVEKGGAVEDKQEERSTLPEHLTVTKQD